MPCDWIDHDEFGKFVIDIYGRTDEGDTAMLRVRGYKPYFYVASEYDFATEDHGISKIKVTHLEKFDVFAGYNGYVPTKVQKDLKFDFSIFDKKINVVDIVYNPENTRFLKDARKNGHKIFTGLDMFVYQAQKSFYIWNKKNPKITKDIYKKLRKKING